MYTTLPKSWRDDFDVNVTITELNDALVTLHLPAIIMCTVLAATGIIGKNIYREVSTCSMKLGHKTTENIFDKQQRRKLH